MRLICGYKRCGVGLMVLCLALQQRVYIHYASQSSKQTGEQSISTEGHICRHSFIGPHRSQYLNCATVQHEFHQHVFRNSYILNLT